MTDTTKKQGIVKWFNGKRGYGFVTDPESNEDIFIHRCNIQSSMDCWKTLTQGEYVKVTREETGEKSQADIRGIRGGPLMCETNHKINLERTKDEKRNQDIKVSLNKIILNNKKINNIYIWYIWILLIQ